jgi:hypothetical protein
VRRYYITVFSPSVAIAIVLPLLFTLCIILSFRFPHLRFSLYETVLVISILLS